jgi:glycosyltransferase involved in cell wall biosynthesis
MPAYNAATFIAASVQSVLNQTFTDFELIIVNDGSTDDTERIVCGFTDPRIVYVENRKNEGLVFSRNRGLDIAQGSFIALLDSDDIALPAKFEKQIAFLNQNKEISLVGSGACLIDENGLETGEKWVLKAPTKSIAPILLFNSYMVHSSVVARAEVFKTLRYNAAFEYAEDYHLVCTIASKYRIANLPEVLVKYRVHTGNTSTLKRDKMVASIKNAQLEMLKNLGIEASAEDVEKHYAIANSTFTPSSAFLKESKSWLRLLFKQNQELKNYESRYFNFILLRMWLKIMLASAKQHPLHTFLFAFRPPFLATIRVFKY